MESCNLVWKKQRWKRESRRPILFRNNFGSLWDFGPRPAFSSCGLKWSRSFSRLLQQLPSPLAALSPPKEDKGRRDGESGEGKMLR